MSNSDVRLRAGSHNCGVCQTKRHLKKHLLTKTSVASERFGLETNITIPWKDEPLTNKYMSVVFALGCPQASQDSSECGSVPVTKINGGIH